MTETNINLNELTVENNETLRRFEILFEGHDPAILTYSLRGDRLDLLHAETPKELEGRGIAAKVTKYALDYAREHKLRVGPLCPYVAVYIKRHPEYAGL